MRLKPRKRERYIPDDLDREIELANRRDFGPGEEREDRYQRRSLADDVQQEYDQRSVDAEVPTDLYDRAEFLAREMRFPNEQRAQVKDKPLDHGMVRYLLTPEELCRVFLWVSRCRSRWRLRQGALAELAREVPLVEAPLPALDFCAPVAAGRSRSPERGRSR